MASARHKRPKPQPVDDLTPSTVDFPAHRGPMPNWIFTLFCAFLLALPIAERSLYYSFPSGVEVKPDASRFIVVNAITLTGFSTPTQIDHPVGRIIILLLTLAGAMFAMIVGACAVTRIVGLPYTDDQIIRAAATVLASLTLLGAGPLLHGGDTFFNTLMDALQLSASAISNSGVVATYFPAVTSASTHLVILPLAALGSIGLPVLMELFDSIVHKRPISPFSRTVLALWAWLYLISLLLFILVRLVETPPSDWGDTARLIAASSAAAINARTLGMPFELAQSFPRALQWIFILLMIIGGSPGSTAGGLKTTILPQLLRGTRSVLRGLAPSRGFGIALSWLALYFTIATTSFLLLILTAPQAPAERLLFDTISALSNVGLSHDAITLTTPPLDILTLTMLLGRLTPLAILWWMARTVPHDDLPIG